MTPNLETWLNELEVLERAAMTGPWFADLCNTGPSCWCRTIGNKPGDDSLENCICSSGSIHKSDAEFIAASRNALPRLLQIIRVQNESLNKVMKQCTTKGTTQDGCSTECMTAYEALVAVDRIVKGTNETS